jgi:hypothetical protein
VVVYYHCWGSRGGVMLIDICCVCFCCLGAHGCSWGIKTKETLPKFQLIFTFEWFGVFWGNLHVCRCIWGITCFYWISSSIAIKHEHNMLGDLIMSTCKYLSSLCKLFLSWCGKRRQMKHSERPAYLRIALEIFATHRWKNNNFLFVENLLSLYTYIML